MDGRHARVHPAPPRRRAGCNACTHLMSALLGKNLASSLQTAVLWLLLVIPPSDAAEHASGFGPAAGSRTSRVSTIVNSLDPFTLQGPNPRPEAKRTPSGEIVNAGEHSVVQFRPEARLGTVGCTLCLCPLPFARHCST